MQQQDSTEGLDPIASADRGRVVVSLSPEAAAAIAKALQEGEYLEGDTLPDRAILAGIFFAAAQAALYQIDLPIPAIRKTDDFFRRCGYRRPKLF